MKYFIFLISISAVQSLWAKEVGQIKYTYGAVTMQNMDGSSARLIAKNERLQRADVLKTGPRSFAIVKLNDGTRMTIRPNSTFSVERFKLKKTSADSTVLRLYSGGMRVISGHINNKKPGSYQLKTDIASLGIYRATFDVRICRDDCEEENRKYKKVHGNTTNAEVVEPGLYVSTTKGKLKLTNKDGLTLNVRAGQSTYVDVLGRRNKRLVSTPMFQQFDVYPPPDVTNSAAINIRVKAIGEKDSGVVCEIE